MSGPLQFVTGLGMVPADQVSSAGDEMQPGSAIAPETVPPPPPLSIMAPAPRPPTAQPLNVLALARARLKVVEREIKLRDRLMAERDELRRLIAAARPTTKRRQAAH